MKTKQEEQDHLQWIYDRLVEYADYESLDFMVEFKRIIDNYTNQDKWISVENRTPEITMKTSSDWVLTFDKVNCRIDKAFFSNVCGWQAEHGEKMNVTYWMELVTPPLPKAPELNNLNNK